MTNEELKNKIVDIVRISFKKCSEFPTCTGCEYFGKSKYCLYENIADALIAAEIGDVSELKKHRVVVEKSLIPEDDNAYILPNIPPTVKQLYSGEEVEQIVKEREEYKHRAEVAGRIAKRACDIVFSQEIDSEEWDEAIFNYKKEKGIREIGITPNILYDYLKEQAEKELAEESKDD